MECLDTSLGLHIGRKDYVNRMHHIFFTTQLNFSKDNHGAGNTGAGGGGSSGGGTRYSGGSGRVMIRYPV